MEELQVENSRRVWHMWSKHKSVKRHLSYRFQTLKWPSKAYLFPSPPLLQSFSTFHWLLNYQWEEEYKYSLKIHVRQCDGKRQMDRACPLVSFVKACQIKWKTGIMVTLTLWVTLIHSVAFPVLFRHQMFYFMCESVWELNLVWLAHCSSCPHVFRSFHEISPNALVC